MGALTEANLMGINLAGVLLEAKDDLAKFRHSHY